MTTQNDAYATKSWNSIKTGRPQTRTSSEFALLVRIRRSKQRRNSPIIMFHFLKTKPTSDKNDEAALGHLRYFYFEKKLRVRNDIKIGDTRTRSRMYSLWNSTVKLTSKTKFESCGRWGWHGGRRTRSRVGLTRSGCYKPVRCGPATGRGSIKSPPRFQVPKP